MAKDYSKVACNTFTFYFMFEIYIFTKNGQILFKKISAGLRFSAQSSIRPFQFSAQLD
jgi:hypothetical protein